MDAMAKTITLGALELMSVDRVGGGWRVIKDRAEKFGTLAYWQRIARTLDAGGFDFLFFADATGYPTDADGVPEEVLRDAVQIPTHDPITVLSGLAATVDRLNFVVTASTTIENPFMHARRFASLDHLLGGRLGWNIVNSDNQPALVKLLGHAGIAPHNERYDRAAEFTDLCFQLWEGSWQDDALLVDRENGVFADPVKIHTIEHHGKFYDLEGIFQVEPSPQRTPTIFQAGSSTRGRDFGASVAEGMYIGEATLEAVTREVASVRDFAVKHGRDPHDIKVMNSGAFFVADSEAEAEDRYERSLAATSDASHAMHFLAWTGVNLLKLDPDKTLAEASTEFGQGVLAKQDDGRTVREIIEGLKKNLGGMQFFGTAESIVDKMEPFIDEGDLDGFLVESTAADVEPYADFVGKIVPELRRRGRLNTSTEPETLRERLFGDGPRVNARHRAATFKV